MFRLPFSILFFLISGFTAGVLSAQSLEEKRTTFETKVVATLEPVNRMYVVALRRLEKEYALEKNYEAAMAVRDERLAVEKLQAEGAGGSGTTTASTSTTSTTTAANTTEDLVFKGSAASALDGATSGEAGLRLSVGGQSGEWALDSVEPGGYEVMVTYAAAAEATLQAMEHFFRITADIPSTGGGDTFKTISLGTLKITSRAEKISVSLKNGADLLLQDVKLVSNRE